MGQANEPSLQEDGRGRRRRLLLALLLLVALTTTSMVSYLLGRSASGPLGQATDTIQLAPEEASTRTATHLTGQVAYEDGSPAAGLKLELHSDPIVTEADDEGVFLFPNVPFGTHRIIVYGPDGSVAAERPVSIVQSSDEQGVSITKEGDGGCAITVAVDVRILEIAIRLQDDGLDILATGCTYANGEGRVTTPAGSVSVESGVVVTPNGHVHLPDGTIVIPRSGRNAAAIILPDDTVVYPDEQVDGSGYTVATDGTVALADGTEIRPGGQVVTPDGATHGPGEGGVVVSGGSVVTPIGGSSSGGGNAPSGPPSGNDSPGSVAGPVRDLPSAGSGSSGGEAPSTGDSPGGTTGDDPSTSDDPPSGDNPSSGSLFVYGENRGGYASWTQNSVIDLFYNRTSGAQEPMAPGSSGSYRFLLQNSRASRLNVTISLSEAGLHVPLAFTLTPLDADGRRLADQAVAGSLSARGGLALHAAVAGHAIAGYRLDWVWPAEGNDAVDTAIGSGESLVYLLSVTIHAEES